jgi:hypothetical protein
MNLFQSHARIFCLWAKNRGVNKLRKSLRVFGVRAKNRAFRSNSSPPAGSAGFPLQSLAPHGLLDGGA